MNRTELNRKLKQNHANYTKRVSEIDRKSRDRERKKLDELLNQTNEIPLNTPKIEQKRTIPEETNKDSELYNMWKRWKFYSKSFPLSKVIWINQFPEWFRDAMNEIETDK